jgi:hypothetical protein
LGRNFSRNTQRAYLNYRILDKLVAQPCNHSTLEAEAEGSQVQGKTETSVSGKKKKKERKKTDKYIKIK